MKELYRKWYLLDKHLPFLIYTGMTSTHAGSLKLFFKAPHQSRNTLHEKAMEVTVEFEIQPASYRVGDESYRQRTLAMLPTLGVTSFWISNHSYFLNDFYADAGELYQDIEFEHLLIVTDDSIFDVILDERPKVYISN
ncbi:hypothetical protein ABLT94_10520 [Acinetobacter soli]|uniref:hypothetical protein n=1 Tax=Acinetobacter soli TaxID=487316 RepID=UPI0032B40AD7